MAELEAIEEFLNETLNQDPILTGLVHGAWSRVAPQETPYPFIIYQFMAGTHVRKVGTKRIMLPALYLVKVVGEGNDTEGTLETVADRLDTLLDPETAVTTVVTRGWIIGSFQEQPFFMSQFDSVGTEYTHRGGLYRIYAQPTP